MAKTIHGGTDRSAMVGLIDCVMKRCKLQIYKEMVSTKKLDKQIYISALKEYESAHENICRSIQVYYNGGVIGKRKYRKLYRDSAYKISDKGVQGTRISIGGWPANALYEVNPYRYLIQCTRYSLPRHFYQGKWML